MQDVLYDTGKVLRIANGDFVTGASTRQHQELLIICSKGEFKENPTVCIGAYGYLKDNDFAGLLAEMKTEFERDGMTVKSLQVIDEKIYPDAHY